MATLRNVLYRQLRHCSISPRGGSSISRLAGLGSYRVNLAAAAACTVDSSSNTFLKPTTTTITSQQRRHYTPVTKDEEEQEKLRVTTLTEFQKDQELRKYNRELAKLEFLKGINTGDLYTWSGKYKVSETTTQQNDVTATVKSRSQIFSAVCQDQDAGKVAVRPKYLSQ